MMNTLCNVHNDNFANDSNNVSLCSQFLFITLLENKNIRRNFQANDMFVLRLHIGKFCSYV